jgi:hypothetical protein
LRYTEAPLLSQVDSNEEKFRLLSDYVLSNYYKYMEDEKAETGDLIDLMDRDDISPQSLSVDTYILGNLPSVKTHLPT